MKTQENMYGNYDVRVSVYSVTRDRSKVAHIVFFNDVDELFDSKRIKLERKGNRLYFVSTNTKGSVLLSREKLQFYKKEYVKICEEFKGVYALECDDNSNFYINLEHKDVIDFKKRSQ